MPYTEAQKRANEKYEREHIKRVVIKYRNEDFEPIAAAAESAGETVSGYIKQAVADRMERGY